MAASLSWSSCKLSSSSAYICVWNPVAFGSIWNASSPPPSDRTTVTVSRNHSKKKKPEQPWIILFWTQKISEVLKNWIESEEKITWRRWL
jgi:hypothetical protein